MFVCNCGRKFTTSQGLGNHKNFCGKNKISLDQGYEYFIDDEGYLRYVHRYVMEKKLGRKLESFEIVHHKDENRRNNNPDNLELTSTKDHGKHHIDILSEIEKSERARRGVSTRIEKNTLLKGSKIGTSKLTEDMVKIIRNRLKEGEKINKIAKEFFVDESNIRMIRDRVTWKHIE